MRELINDQTIDFDIHAAGNGQAIGLDGLHMHKRMNGKRYRGVHVLFPLDGNQQITFRPPHTNNLIRKQLMNEIRRVVSKSREKREELVGTIIEEIRKYSNNLPSGEQVDSIKRGAERIAKVFSKNGKVENEMKQQIEGKLKFYMTSHTDENERQFFIKQDFLRNRITLSEDIEELNKKSF
jgi:hypothetical protein